MALSKQDQEKFLAEVFDPEGIAVYCGDHMYFGPGKSGKMRPHNGCSRCWMVYFICDIAGTPPSQRQERLDELEQVINHVVEAVEHGSWDFKVDSRPAISVHKDTEPLIMFADEETIEV